jgi:hypothetical protein
VDCDPDRDEAYRQKTFQALWLLSLLAALSVYFTAKIALLLFFLLNFEGYGPAPEPPPLTLTAILLFAPTIAFIASPVALVVGTGTAWGLYVKERYRGARIAMFCTAPWLLAGGALLAAHFRSIH